MNVRQTTVTSGFRKFASAVAAGLVRLTGNHPNAVGIAGTLAAIVVIVVPLAVVEGGRENVIARARENAENLNALVATDLEQRFKVYDVQLQDLVAVAEDPDTWTFPEKTRERQLFRRLPDDAYVDGKLIVGADGRIIASQGDRKVNPALRLNDRAYFLDQQNDPSAGLVVSHPFRSRLHAGRLSIALTRRINGPDGSFAGIAFFEIQLELFGRLFSRVNVKEPGIVEILLDDGTVLAAKPFSEARVGTSVARIPVFREAMGHESGTITATGSGNVERLYSYQRVSGLPFIAVVAPAMDDVLANWRRQRLITESVAILFGVVLTIGAWVLAWTLRDKLRAQAELASLAATDPLTKLNNRRTLDQRLQIEWNHALREQRPLSVLFVDVDRFKLFNDTYGHVAGDDVLATVARCVASATRRSVDLVARYGGEEFMAVLPDTGHDGAVQVAETIRANVEALGIGNPGSETGRVTVSIGCATCVPSNDGSPDRLVSIADEQLYRAKSSGRNQVQSIIVNSMAASPANMSGTNAD
ncbi:GGDEF domain-containing protein [Paraburkholderia lycopersici]|uniref:diguanylate cyclase n=1 Tax=Paraburkholderia lycopersici TaxID=416944 RepID=A0A1G6MNN2_9BURK|nr:sensor domain-containing diguanylate cyclase [Paraburkholderia lycopersici]SDC57081.1 diguanylate cyclase (GGDEF) domain-containing protein [Paraburkholderia lycopersici]